MLLRSLTILFGTAFVSICYWRVCIPKVAGSSEWQERYINNYLLLNYRPYAKPLVHITWTHKESASLAAITTRFDTCETFSKPFEKSGLGTNRLGLSIFFKYVFS